MGGYRPRANKHPARPEHSTHGKWHGSPHDPPDPSHRDGQIRDDPLELLGRTDFNLVGAESLTPGLRRWDRLAEGKKTLACFVYPRAYRGLRAPGPCELLC